MSQAPPACRRWFQFRLRAARSASRNQRCHLKLASLIASAMVVCVAALVAACDEPDARLELPTQFDADDAKLNAAEQIFQRG